MATAGLFAEICFTEAGVKLGRQDAVVIKLRSPHILPTSRFGACASSWRALGSEGGSFATGGGWSDGRKASSFVAKSSTLVKPLEVSGSDGTRGDAIGTGVRPPGWRQPGGNLAPRWKEIAGQNNWENLLDPLDPDLKREILRSGDFIWPAYDAIDTDPASKYRGSSLYHPKKLLDKVKLQGTGYTVTKYLYMLSDVDFVNRFSGLFQFPTGSEEGDFWSKDSNWMGYVAVATDEEEIKRLGRRDIIVAFRGTHTAKEWVLNVFNFLWPTGKADDSVPWTDVVKVEAGFWKMFTGKSDETPFNKKSLQEQVQEEIRRLIWKYQGEELSITLAGHSLGGSLATLAAYDLSNSGANRLPSSNGATVDGSAAAETSPQAAAALTAEKALVKIWKNLVQTIKTLLPGVTAEKKPIPIGFLPGTVPITAYCFGSPRVGNDDFRDALQDLGVKVLRVENPSDIVCKFPGIVFNEWHVQMADKWLSLFFDSFPWTYIHVGTRFEVDHKDSPYLEEKPEFMAVHDIEVYLHLIDGYEHSGMKFNPDVHEMHRRDYVLVNKYGSLIKETYKIPEAWYQVENKGMFHDLQGRWRLAEREDCDIPQACVGVFDDDEEK